MIILAHHDQLSVTGIPQRGRFPENRPQYDWQVGFVLRFLVEQPDLAGRVVLETWVPLPFPNTVAHLLHLAPQISRTFCIRRKFARRIRRLHRVLDAQKGVEVEALVPVQKSLEDLFLALTRKEIT